MSLKKMLALGLIGCLFTINQSAAAVTPTEQVREVVDAVMDVLKQTELGQEERQQGIRDLIVPYFDFEAMSRSVLANNWKKASDVQRAQFVSLFKQLMGNTYIAAMEAYNNETVRYGKETVRKNNKALVETFIVGPSLEIPVVYRMRQRGDRWLAYDLVIEGVSIVRNYRTSFASLVRKQGLDGMLARLEEKVQGG